MSAFALLPKGDKTAIQHVWACATDRRSLKECYVFSFVYWWYNPYVLILQ